MEGPVPPAGAGPGGPGPAADPAEARGPSRGRVRPGAARLLVVDDSADNRYTLVQRLAREGYTDVLTAADGVQALTLLAERPVDLVLLDVMMPGLNGYQVLERLKADGRLRHIPMGVLGEYHGSIGPLILEHGGTLERFTGDGLMVFFNDPVKVPDPAARAVRLAVAARARVDALAAGWRRLGHELGLGVGIAQGYATIGAIGFEGRRDYSAIGTVTNLAARLCAEARSGQILVSSRVAGDVEPLGDLEEIGPLVLKGLTRPVPAFNVRRLH
jgi:CheY-like chemotaxis protein